MYAEVVEQYIELYNGSVANRRHYRIDCPFCEDNVGTPDTKGHMHLFVDTWYSHCFKCGGNFHATTIFEKLGILNYPKRSVTDVSDIVKGKVAVNDELPLRDPIEVDMPSGTFPIADSGSIAWRRPLGKLAEWGINVKTAIELKWMWNTGGDMFVFPCFIDGVLCYWQTRSMSGARSSCPGDLSSCGVLYNFDDKIKDSVQEVYVVEGPKDAAIMHQNGLWGVALMGHAISPYQMQRLQAMKHEKRLVLDADVFHSSNALEAKGMKTYFLPSGDPADAENRTQLTDVLARSTGLGAKVRQLIKNRQVS